MVSSIADNSASNIIINYTIINNKLPEDIDTSNEKALQKSFEKKSNGIYKEELRKCPWIMKPFGNSRVTSLQLAIQNYKIIY